MRPRQSPYPHARVGAFGFDIPLTNATVTFRPGDAIKDVWNGLGDFAKTDFGQFTLTLLSTGLYANLIANPNFVNMPAVGQFMPQFATAVFAIPGVAQGDSFSKAWTTAMYHRAAAALGAEAGRQAAPANERAATASLPTPYKDNFLEQVGVISKDPNFKLLVDQAKTRLGPEWNRLSGRELQNALKKQGFTPEGLATRFGIRPDSAATVINGLSGKEIYAVGEPIDGQSDYDVSGNLFHPDTFTTLPDFLLHPNGPKPVKITGHGSGSPPLVSPGAGLSPEVVRSLRLQLVEATARGDHATAARLESALAGGGGSSIRLSKDGPDLSIAVSSPHGVLRQLFTAFLLTSPAWAPVVLPSLLRKFSR